MSPRPPAEATGIVLSAAAAFEFVNGNTPTSGHRVLSAWVNNHPEERLTKPQLFNIMRAATGEFIELWGGSDPKTRLELGARIV